MDEIQEFYPKGNPAKKVSFGMVKLKW